MSAITVNKRVMKDIADARNLEDELGILVEPEQNNMYNIHFVLQGPEKTPFEGGLYHGMIRLSPNHPLNAPNIHMFTPSGRFVAEAYPLANGSRGICTTATSFHPEEWTSVSSITTTITGFVSLMCDPKDQGVGGIISTDEEKKKFTMDSINCIKKDPIIKKLFPDLYESLMNGTYKPKILSDIAKNPRIVENKPKILSDGTKTPIAVENKEEILQSSDDSDSGSDSDNDIVCVSDSDEDIKSKKSTKTKSTKQITNKKIANESHSDFDSSDDSDDSIVLTKKKPLKKITNNSESDEEPIKSKKKQIKKPIKNNSTKKINNSEPELESESDSEPEVKAKKSIKKIPNKKSRTKN